MARAKTVFHRLFAIKLVLDHAVYTVGLVSNPFLIRLFTEKSITLTFARMKISIALGVIQSALIIYLVVAINELADSNRRLSDEQPGVDFNESRYTIVPTPAPSSHPTNIDENLLRQIIREELSLQLPAYVSGDGPEEEMYAPTQRSDTGQYSRDEIELSIEQLKGTGEVSAAEMHALEARIVTLDKAERMQMMSKLMAAMNAGEIKGRFQ
jgi:hypothetical protein